LLEATHDLDIRLTTENQGGQPIEPFAQVVDEIDSERFGVILDIGHPRDPDGVNPFVKEDSARSMLASLGRRLVSHPPARDLRPGQESRPPDLRCIQTALSSGARSLRG